MFRRKCGNKNWNNVNRVAFFIVFCFGAMNKKEKRNAVTELLETDKSMSDIVKLLGACGHPTVYKVF